MIITMKSHFSVFFWRFSSAQNNDARATLNEFVYLRSTRRNQPTSSCGPRSAAWNSGV